MKGFHVLVMILMWNYVCGVKKRPTSPTFCHAKTRAFNDTRMCFSHPYDCTEDDKVPCQMTMTVQTGGDGIFTFSLSGKLEENQTTGWIALGLSTDRKMGDDDVMMCILDSNDTITLHHRVNEGRTNYESDSPLLNLLHLTDSSSDDGVITCTFERSTLEKFKPSEEYHKFNLLIPRTWYLLFGMGRTNSTGVPLKHRTIPYISDTRIDFTETYRITIWESLMQASSPPHEVKEKYENYRSSANSPTLEFILIFSVLHQVVVTIFL